MTCHISCKEQTVNFGYSTFFYSVEDGFYGQGAVTFGGCLKVRAGNKYRLFLRGGYCAEIKHGNGAEHHNQANNNR